MFKWIICILAGLGAGLGTGFAGLSAASFIAPMLIAFLDTPVYEAVGIALASDVLASAVSAATYASHGNIDLKHGRPLLISILIAAVVGSSVGYIVTSVPVGNTFMGYATIIGSMLLGVKFFFPTKQRESKQVGGKKSLVITCGLIIGFISGFQGVGGGLLMLFVLTTVMYFDYHSAVGTSVFIMTFTALLGATAHFIIKGIPEILPLEICIASTFIFARIASVISNHLSEKKMHLITGLLLTVSGAIMLAYKIYSSIIP